MRNTFSKFQTDNRQGKQEKHNKEKRQLEMEVNSANAAVEEAINSGK